MTGNVAASALTLGNLVRATGGEVNFSGTNLGQNGFATTQVFLNQVNGGSTVSSLSNGILGGWATVNGTDFAGYVTSNGTQGGVGALNRMVASLRLAVANKFASASASKPWRWAMP